MANKLWGFCDQCADYFPVTSRGAPLPRHKSKTTGGRCRGSERIPNHYWDK